VKEKTDFLVSSFFDFSLASFVSERSSSFSGTKKMEEEENEEDCKRLIVCEITEWNPFQI
jgi:hypothetical protein